ncbi:hypothetical protein LINPERHAP1_LOCUS12053 [Linum perenne]
MRSARSVWASSRMGRGFGSCPNAAMSSMCGASTNGLRYIRRVRFAGIRWPGRIRRLWLIHRSN